MPILIIAVVVIVLYLVGFYNKVKTLQVHIRASIQEIGNQLKRQAELIPNLVESVKGYLKHEKGIFEDLVSARKSITEAVATNNPEKIDQSQQLISKVLGSLKVIVESNPEIKGAQVTTDLMNELRDTSDKVMYSRRTLIDVTADYNTAITTVPGIWFASIFGFKEEKGLITPLSGEHLEVSAEDVKTPKISLN
ncbi:MAG: LemA family protein [Candidatus Shapirobacteria bacterium]